MVTIRAAALSALGLLGALSLSGCSGGQQDMGGFSRSLGGDIGSGYNSSLNSRYGGEGDRRQTNNGRGSYPMIQTAFQLASVPGDPFDYEQVNVVVTLRKPDGGTLEVPAFYDGEKTWRMRYTPLLPGQYAVAGIKVNRETAHEEKLEPKEWNVSGEPQPGFVRIDRGDKTRFLFDSGARYYPLGHNQAWHSNNLPDIPELFAKMHDAGENWSRVWMNQWDGKNLDWNPIKGKSVKPGQIDLEAAKRWDSIVEAAGKSGIYFQMTLQHHGQYSSQQGYRFSNNNNANWEDNPYNVKNGGFLQNPEDFFTNPQARAITKRKLRYIVARWGYSPNILAWELFNEVEGTDAGSGKLWDDIAMWHREMALFLRQMDGYHHLITTSANPGVPLDSPVWDTVDYIQTHIYPSDIITAMDGAMQISPKRRDKPSFVGEFGPDGLADPQGTALHNGLWASLMRGTSGAAQYWAWDIVEKNDLYPHFKAASAFLAASGLANQGGLVGLTLPVETSQKSALRFGPGGGWGNATQSEFVVGAGSAPSGMDQLPAFLQGQSHRNMMPKPLAFQVTYAQPGTFSVRIAKVAKAGGKLVVRVDGKESERAYAPGSEDYAPKEEQATVQVAVPTGAHTVTVENTGADWLVVKQFALSDYAPALGATGRMSKDYAVAWVINRGSLDATTTKSAEPVTGRINLAGLKSGRYSATWWDTAAGKALDTVEVTVGKEKEPTWLATPPIARDAALYVVKAGTASAGGKPDKRKGGKAALSAAPSVTPGSGSPAR